MKGMGDGAGESPTPGEAPSDDDVSTKEDLKNCSLQKCFCLLNKIFTCQIQQQRLSESPSKYR